MSDNVLENQVAELKAELAEAKSAEPSFPTLPAWIKEKARLASIFGEEVKFSHATAPTCGPRVGTARGRAEPGWEGGRASRRSPAPGRGKAGGVEGANQQV